MHKRNAGYSIPILFRPGPSGRRVPDNKFYPGQRLWFYSGIAVKGGSEVAVEAAEY